MKKNRVKRMFIGSSILILALFFIPFTKCLIISPVEEQSFTYIPIQPNEVFRIEYTHSIHLSQVEEWYAARNHKIELFKMVYEDTSIGMPSKGDEGTSFRITEEGKYEISNMNRFFLLFI
ncbi:hypothetical protein Q73_04250 [Bacillus coahuilensis m2-6]|uniref:DUF1850 domain-containing protein n=1 Tax=Bacillus coahuilensis TaxID=408580 RepID=UPI00075029EC|nr:DUF1850 domain-containing protein [Bacillus coahuilensis]KUP08940.1 hypothetical protein Q73_04250 [Bacillus coahuilensis m2-6]